MHVTSVYDIMSWLPCTKKLVGVYSSFYMYMSVGSFAATKMNDRSSRSHVIFTITIESCNLGTDQEQHIRMGKLHLVDLAVSYI